MDCDKIYLPSLSDDELQTSSPKKKSMKNNTPYTSKLIMRRGLVKPLNLTTNKANSDRLLDFSSLIKEMKDYCRTKTSLLPLLKESIVPKANKLEYIFTQSNSAGKSLKEEKLNDFLNSEGIFQINTSVVMKELKFNK